MRGVRGATAFLISSILLAGCATVPETQQTAASNDSNVTDDFVVTSRLIPKLPAEASAARDNITLLLRVREELTASGHPVIIAEAGAANHRSEGVTVWADACKFPLRIGVLTNDGRESNEWDRNCVDPKSQEFPFPPRGGFSESFQTDGRADFARFPYESGGSEYFAKGAHEIYAAIAWYGEPELRVSVPFEWTRDPPRAD